MYKIEVHIQRKTENGIQKKNWNKNLNRIYKISMAFLFCEHTQAFSTISHSTEERKEVRSSGKCKVIG